MVDKVFKQQDGAPEQAWVAACKDLALWDTQAWRDNILRLNQTGLKYLDAVLPMVRQRLLAMTAELKTYFQGKDEIIDLMLYASVAQEPMLLFGEPGTAKSHLAVKFAEGLNVHRNDQPESTENKTYFEYLLNQYTEPDELLGPVIIKELTGDEPHFKRFRSGMLTTAYVVFLDEIFRANSAILNALLSIINERRVYEAGTAVQANLVILFGAANHPPRGEELLAFYERFPLRAMSTPVPLNDHDARTQLLGKGWQLEAQRLGSAYDTNHSRLENQSCLSDILLCSRAVMEKRPLTQRAQDQITNDGRKIVIDAGHADFVRQYIEVVRSLNQHDSRLCHIDDRKFVKLYKLMGAQALFRDGQSIPKTEDLRILKHTWHDPYMRDALAEDLESLIRNVGERIAR
jgi:MoxR-like ATPase